MKFWLLFLISLSLAVAGTSSMAAEKNTSNAKAAIAAAEQSQKKAASVDGEWRETGNIIKKAKAALKEGNVEKAIKLANFANRQGQYGYEQAVSQKNLKMPSYLKY